MQLIEADGERAAPPRSATKLGKAARRQLGSRLLAYEDNEAYYQTSVGVIWASELPPRESGREDRVRCIMQLMRDLRFSESETPDVLAHAWDLCMPVVRQYTGEANRRVRAEVCDVEVVSRNVGTVLFEALRAARTGQRWELIARLAKTWADIMGATAAHRVAVAVDPTATMTRDEIAALAAEAASYAAREGDDDVDSGSGGDDEGDDEGVDDDDL